MSAKLEPADTILRRAGRRKPCARFRPLPAGISLAAMISGGLFAGTASYAQPRESLAGESEAQALKKSIEAEQYDLRYGPVRMKIDAGLGVSYTDNLFYSQNGKEDMLVKPEATL